MNKVALLLYFIGDNVLGLASQFDQIPATVSSLRVNREVKDQELKQTFYDEASLRCMYRVKQRMSLGSACQTPPYFTRANAKQAAVASR